MTPNTKHHLPLIHAKEAEFYALVRARRAAIDNASTGNPFACPAVKAIEALIADLAPRLPGVAAVTMREQANRDYDAGVARCTKPGTRLPGAEVAA